MCTKSVSVTCLLLCSISSLSFFYFPVDQAIQFREIASSRTFTERDPHPTVLNSVLVFQTQFESVSNCLVSHISKCWYKCWEPVFIIFAKKCSEAVFIILLKSVQRTFKGKNIQKQFTGKKNKIRGSFVKCLLICSEAVCKVPLKIFRGSFKVPQNCSLRGTFSKCRKIFLATPLIRHSKVPVQILSGTYLIF
jgi:hypothetical protein